MTKTIIKPWGSFDVLHEDSEYWVKRLTVWPDQALSLQSHKLRHEEWVVVSGFGKAYLRHWPQTLMNGEWFGLKPGETISIPPGYVHRLINDSEVDLVVIEVALGICREDDIERLEDDYDRLKDK